MKERNHAVGRGLMHEPGTMSSAVALYRTGRDREVLAFGTALAVAALLHLGLVFYLSRPAPERKASPAVMNYDQVTVTDLNNVEVPVDPSYRPDVLPFLPEASQNQAGDGSAVADLSQGKINANVLDIMPGDETGPVLVIGNNQKSLNELLQIPEYHGNGGRPVVGVRGRPPVEVVPFYKVEAKPQPVRIPVPAYPEAVRAAGIEGRTVVEALVDTDGSVMMARVLASSGNAALDSAACDAARAAKFTPARQRDKAVRVWVSVPYQFSLK